MTDTRHTAHLLFIRWLLSATMEWMARVAFKAATIILVVLASSAALAASGIYVQDDFAGNERFFFQGTLGDSTYTYHSKQGFYEINAMKSKSGALATITDAFSRYEVSAEAQFYDAAPQATTYAGIVFHYAEDERQRASFYLFAVFRDGYYGVWRVDREAKRSYVFPLKKTELVSPADFNRIRVRADGSRFYLYLNGIFVGEFQDHTLNAGGVGLYASGGSIARFRSFRWRVAADEATGQIPANGPFGWLPSHDYEGVFQDDFRQKLWREGESGTADFTYTDTGYEIDNSRGTTMALSYRSRPIADEGIVLVVFKKAEGSERNGFGLGFAFDAASGAPSYYAFVIARDGTFKLFKTSDGVSEVLLPWQELPFEVDFERPVLLAAGYLREGSGLRIIVGVNGKPLASILDEKPLQPGGFALLAAPLVRTTVSAVTLLALTEKSQEVLRNKLDAWLKTQTATLEGENENKAG